MRGVLLFILIFSLLPAEAKDFTIQLSPDTPRVLATESTPLDKEHLLEIADFRDGLWVEPATAFKWCFTPAESKALNFQAHVNGEKFDQALLTIWNWHNRPVYETRLDAGEIHQLSIDVEGLGAYQITLEGLHNGEAQARLVRSFAVTEDLAAARENWCQDEFALGICAFPGRYHWKFEEKPTLPHGIYPNTARKLEAQLMAKAGLHWVRIDESMEMGAPLEEGNDYRYDFKRMDAGVKAFTDQGFKLALQLMHAPDWAVHRDYPNVKQGHWRYPHDESVQQAYSRKIIERYQDHIAVVQVFNEADQPLFWSGTSAEYVRLFQQTQITATDILPQIPVINGGYSLYRKNRTRAIANGLKNQTSHVAYHSHGKVERLAQDYHFVRKLHQDLEVESPIYLNTEMGYDGWRLDQERRKGQYVPQKTLFCWANHHRGVIIFGSRMVLGPQRRNQDFGFLDHYFCPRYVYGSFTAMTSALAGCSFEKTLIDSDTLKVYQFRRGADRVLSFFNNGDQTVRLSISARSDGAQFIDEMGNRTEGIPFPDKASWWMEPR
ncbi:MAG: hypothetical protein AAF226_09815 [Verrucomicrobiota bacterium]